MRYPREDITLEVNLRNPGQFFACCGVLELAARRWPAAEGWFADSEFHVAIHSEELEPLKSLLDPLLLANPMVVFAADAHFFAPKLQPLILKPVDLRLDWWLRPGATGHDGLLRLWAARQAPRDILEDLRSVCVTNSGGAPPLLAAPRDRSALQWRCCLSGRFGFDPGPAWRALDMGFSLNDQGIGDKVLTSPITELLAAVGLQRFRPPPVSQYSLAYAAWSHPLPLVPASACASGLLAGRRYRFAVVKRTNPDERAVPGKDYQSFGYAEPA